MDGNQEGAQPSAQDKGVDSVAVRNDISNLNQDSASKLNIGEYSQKQFSGTSEQSINDVLEQGARNDMAKTGYDSAEKSGMTEYSQKQTAPEVTQGSAQNEPPAETLNNRQIIESEAKRLAGEINRARAEAQAQGNTEKPDIELVYDIAMKLTILRNLEKVKTNGGAFQDHTLEQNRQQEIDALKKAQIDSLSEFYSLVAQRGENFYNIGTSMMADVAQIADKVNLFRVEEKVKTELKQSQGSEDSSEAQAQIREELKQQEPNLSAVNNSTQNNPTQ
ncbi:MAG TPA: hypothetical protein VES68_00965 [Candidatus Sulfotelmatobacter sp.]|nr:hypothetical protein [Candidatus Sulfotelmatobacter sp.]